MTPERPKRLEPGDTIGVVSPSSPVTPEVLDKTVGYWRSRGYEVELGRNVLANAGYMAGAPAQRAEDLNAMLADERITLVIAAMGGKSANQLLPLIDYGALRARPKIFMGLSDSSILSVALHAQTGVVTFHGPTGVNFGLLGVPEYTERQMFRALTRPEPLGPLPAYSEWTSLRAGPPATGTLLAGHLSTLRSLLGTRYAPRWAGAVLFVEEVFVELHDVDAALTHFRLAGVFDEIAGLVVGRPLDVAERSYDIAESLPDVVARCCDGYRFPILYNVDFGHTDEKLTLPVGVQVTLVTDTPALVVEEPGVR